MRGETVVATIRRLRLQRAADQLANSDADIQAITRRASYSSSDSFGRAFKETFGTSPAAYREMRLACRVQGRKHGQRRQSLSRDGGNLAGAALRRDRSHRVLHEDRPCHGQAVC
ncbi:helix-turn-helix domain-containing protein [Rhizobium rhizophilum]|uniref:helix-turn-helix domain-containing protein n=1 Tax=Rhizobium rhizophilum TaxID=1850373 RepID=UPI001F2D8727|nr:helix-turn-helix domain-containing protein [Rhizobium rhizophilum]